MHTSPINPIKTIPEVTSALWDPETQSFVEPLPGAVVQQYIRCGKPGCRCQGGKKHGPYHYRVWRTGLKVCKAYVRREDLEWVHTQCAMHQQIQDALRDSLAYRQTLLRQIACCRREHTRLSRAV